MGCGGNTPHTHTHTHTQGYGMDVWGFEPIFTFTGWGGTPDHPYIYISVRRIISFKKVWNIQVMTVSNISSS
jgi:hypothetical protein